MKKITLILLTVTIFSTIATPFLKSNRNININNNSNTIVAKTYQTENDWLSYINNDTNFQNILESSLGLTDYTYQGVNLQIQTITIKNNNQTVTTPVGTLLMNGTINSTVGTPEIVNQHIIDNISGNSPLTVNYDSIEQQVQTTISSTFSAGFSDSITASVGLDIPFVSANISTTLSFSFNSSLSATKSVTETVNFDKFSTTIQPKDKEEIDYVVMQNLETFNMVLKVKINLNNSYFTFSNGTNVKEEKLSTIVNNSAISQILGKAFVSDNKNITTTNKFMTINRINNPIIPVQAQSFDYNNMFVYFPLSFALEGYTTLITQTKIS